MQKSVFSIQQLPRFRSHCNLSLLPHKRATAGNGYCTILLLSFVQFVMQLLFRKSTAIQVSKKQLFQKKCFAAERLQTRKYMHKVSYPFKKTKTPAKSKKAPEYGAIVGTEIGCFSFCIALCFRIVCCRTNQCCCFTFCELIRID